MVLGAYDQLTEIADICKRHDMWQHVDSCWGGSVLCSEKYKHNMAGAHLVDSIAWNPHKMMGNPSLLNWHVAGGVLSKD